MKSYQFKLQGLTCEACAKIVKKRVEKIPGVSETTVDPDGNLEIRTDRDLEKSELINALKDTDYKVI